jgi:predicted flap endonuclease-1-like 5' DNA nuclease
MSNLKKEVMSLISRFDAAQEAFSANSVEIKELRKKHKKDLKKSQAEAKTALIEVEALKSELAILRAGAPVKEVSTKRSAGRPKKAATAKPAAKRSPGRPKKAVKGTAAPTAAEPVVPTAAESAAPTAAEPAAGKRGPGRPKKTSTATKPAAKRRAGRPKKAATAAKPAEEGAKKRPGRPRKTPAVPASPLIVIAGVGPAMAAKFEEAGVKTPAAMAKLSNVKMAAILAECGPRYRNADSTKMQAYRDAAAAAK